MKLYTNTVLNFKNYILEMIPCQIYINFFYCCSSTVVSIFIPPRPPTPPIPASYPQTPLALSMCPLYMYLDNPSPIFSHYPFSPSPLVTVHLFLISKSLVIFFLLVCFVDQVPLTGKSIWYLSFTTWLISLSIMLSRSIHAVAKRTSSFFLSAAQYSIV